MSELNYTETNGTIATRTELNETKNKKRVHVCNKDITLFTLSYFFDDAPPYAVVEEDIADGEKKASVKYADPKLQFLQDALTQRIQGTASARYRAGEEADTSIEDIVNRARSGGSTYLSDLKAFKEAVAAFVLSKGKSENFAVNLVKKLDPRVLEDANDKVREVVISTLEAFQEDEEAAEAHKDMLQRMADALSADESWLDEE